MINNSSAQSVTGTSSAWAARLLLDAHWRAAVGGVWTPPVSFIPGLRLLAFLDSGYKDLRVTNPGETSGDLIASAGLGARWRWRQYLSQSLD